MQLQIEDMQMCIPAYKHPNPVFVARKKTALPSVI